MQEPEARGRDQSATSACAGHNVRAIINYAGDMTERPAYYANDLTRDRLKIDKVEMAIRDARGQGASLDAEGFMLARHQSAIRDFRNADEVRERYAREIEKLLMEITGAPRVSVFSGGALRFSERSPEYRTRNNTRPARFAHIDYTRQSLPWMLNSVKQAGFYTPKEGERFHGFNVWRVISDPPQDVPLAVCDTRTCEERDFVPADAIFDVAGQPDFSFEGYVVKHNARHRWSYFSDMTRDEVLIFRNFNSEITPHLRVPHVAFDNPACPPDAMPRASIETRAFAFFD